MNKNVIRQLAGLLFAAAAIGTTPESHAADLAFRRHVINADTDYSAAAVVDVNRDGMPDIVCGGDWYEAPDWKRHFVRDVPRIRDRPDGFAHLTLDVNRDGWTDIITVNFRSRSIKWIQHPGAGFGPWTTHVVVEPGPMETGRLVDIDGDGNVDLLPNGARFAAWYELIWDSDSRVAPPRWVRHELPPEAGGHGLGFGDIDGDGRGDIIGQFGWLKAPEEPRTGRWLWHPEFHLERASVPMIVADVDDDGDRDIVWSSAHGFGIYWLEHSTAPGEGRTWTRHAIDTSWSQCHAPLWVDFDGDGRREFVGGKRYLAHAGADPGAYDSLEVYRYQFDPGTRSWQRWTMSANQRVGTGLDPKAADIDGDGDLDYVTSGRSGLYLLENLGSGSTGRPPLPQYQDHENLHVVLDQQGQARPVESAADWGERRSHIIASLENSVGQLPGSIDRVPLDARAAGSDGTQVSYRVRGDERIAAKLVMPREAALGETPAMLCMFDLPGSAESRQIVEQLAERGYVCLAPDQAPPANLQRALWEAVRAIDYLQSLSAVHAERIGFLGDACGGKLAMILAAVDQRVIATVAYNAGGAAVSGESRDFSASELIAAVAPRSISLHFAEEASRATPLGEAAKNAAAIFQLRRVPDNLRTSERRLLAGERGHNDTLAWLDGRLQRTRRFGRRRPPQVDAADAARAARQPPDNAVARRAPDRAEAPAEFQKREYASPSGETLKYVVYVPANLPDDRPVPFLTFLHGSCAECVTHERILRESNLQYWHGYRRNVQQEPTILMAPAGGRGGWTSEARQQAVFGIIDALLEEFRIDRRRIYLQGFSMGGGGTWRYLQERPGFFAAANPQALGARMLDAELVKDTPIWATIGGDDRSLRRMTANVASIRAANGDPRGGLPQVTGVNPRFSVFPNTNHGGAQQGTQQIAGFKEWMYAQVNDGNVPPNVRFLEPALDAAELPGDVRVLVAADDPGGIARVEFFAGDHKLGEDTEEPFEYAYRDLPAGPQRLVARAVDAGGKSRVAELTVTIGSE